LVARWLVFWATNPTLDVGCTSLRGMTRGEPGPVGSVGAGENVQGPVNATKRPVVRR
jgi:hypothetical protein